MDAVTHRQWGFAVGKSRTWYMKNTRKFVAVAVVIIWLSSFFIVRLEKLNIADKLKKMTANILVDFGYSNSTTISMAKNGSEVPLWLKFITGTNSGVTYIVENGNRFQSVSEKNAEKTAMTWAGKNSRKNTWSGMSGELYRQACQEENEDLELAKKENEAAKKEEKLKGDSEKIKQKDIVISHNSRAALKANISKINTLKKGLNRNYLLKNFYITDSTTSIDDKIFNVKKLLSADLRIKKNRRKPQILIFHTHGGSEAFRDSKSGVVSQSIVGVGTTLTYYLKKQGYNVIHDTTRYDIINGRIDRNRAYNNAANQVKRTLQKYPSVQVVIDLHRDGVGNKVHRTTVINGKRTAQIMLFNGLSRNRRGNIGYLYNPNLQYNLAFSLQLKLKCMENYTDFAKPVYLKGYRYNLHLRKRSLLIELGNENNTLQEAKNAMPHLAGVIGQVLGGR
ncbi:stage II sporulation protein P [Clostridium sp. AF34-13]|nr:stage II sporulation protein P [Clostridium sp. AF34-13]